MARAALGNVQDFAERHAAPHSAKLAPCQRMSPPSSAGWQPRQITIKSARSIQQTVSSGSKKQPELVEAGAR